MENTIIQAADFDVYDVRAPSNDPNPPETYSNYLADKSVVKAIGAKTSYQECPNGPYNKFSSTGDSKFWRSIELESYRPLTTIIGPRSFLSELSSVVQSGIQVLVWAGDADWICNYIGVQRVADAVEFDGSKQFSNATLKSYTVNGTKKGEYKTVDNFSFLRVYEAGHEVPYYRKSFSVTC